MHVKVLHSGSHHGTVLQNAGSQADHIRLSAGLQGLRHQAHMQPTLLQLADWCSFVGQSRPWVPQTLAAGCPGLCPTCSSPPLEQGHKDQSHAAAAHPWSRATWTRVMLQQPTLGAGPRGQEPCCSCTATATGLPLRQLPAALTLCNDVSGRNVAQTKPIASVPCCPGQST